MSVASGPNISMSNLSLYIDPSNQDASSGGVTYSLYTHTSGVHPTTEAEFDTLVDNATFIQGGFHSGTINFGDASQALRWGGTAGALPSYFLTAGDYSYIWIGTGHIYIPEAVSYDFVIDGDDAIEFWVNNIKVSSWYGGHGFGTGANIGTLSFAAAGWYPLYVRMEEIGGGDGVAIAYKKTSDSTFVTVPSSNLRPHNITDKMKNVTIKHRGAGAKTTNTYIEFNGSTTVLSGNKPKPNIVGAISLDYWIYFNNLTSLPVPIHKGGHYTTFYTDNAYSWADSSNYSYANYGTRSATGVSTTGVWKNIAITKNTSGIVKLYINSVLTDTSPTFGSGLTAVGTTTLWIGGYSDTDTVPSINMLNGRMDNIRIYNKELSQTEITQNFNAIRSRYGI